MLALRTSTGLTRLCSNGVRRSARYPEYLSRSPNWRISKNCTSCGNSRRAQGMSPDLSQDLVAMRALLIVSR
jgi:hypothetical protein